MMTFGNKRKQRISPTTYLKQYWPSGLCLTAVLYATLASHPVGVDKLPLFPHIDKLIHCIMMGGLTGAIAFDYYRADTDRHSLTRCAMGIIAVSVAAFSIIDELAQSALTPNRSGDPLDLLADCVGIIIALLSAPPAIRAIIRRRAT